MPLLFGQTQLMSNNSSTLPVQWELNQTQCRRYLPRVKVRHQYHNRQKEIFELGMHVCACLIIAVIICFAMHAH